MIFVFSSKLNEFDLVKLKIPSESELSGIIAGNRTIYDEKTKKRLSFKICNEYDVPSFGGIPSEKLFQCLHFFILNILVIRRNGI